MKTRYIITIFLFASLICNAQTVYLTTPKGSKVYAFENTEMSASDIQYYTNQTKNQYPQAEVLANASATYNCHSYAWNLSEGGTKVCWLNQDPDLHLYWDDGSYVATNENEAVKIFYYAGDHSAIKSSTHTGKYESKWGAMPLMRHSPTYGPTIYNMSTRRYYKGVVNYNFDISGSGAICPGETNAYSIPNLPGESTVTWSSDVSLTAPRPVLEISSSDPNACTIRNTYNYPIEFTLKATIVLAGGYSKTVEKKIISASTRLTNFTGTYTQISSPTVNVVNKAFSSTVLFIQPNIQAEVKFTNVGSRKVVLSNTTGNGKPVSWYYNSSNTTLYVTLPTLGGSVYIFTVGTEDCANGSSDFTFFASTGAPKSLGVAQATVNVYELFTGTKVYTNRNVITDSFDIKSTNLNEGYYVLEMLYENGERTTDKIYLRY